MNEFLLSTFNQIEKKINKEGIDTFKNFVIATLVL